jgi:PAS domain S-box-containing protein
VGKFQQSLHKAHTARAELQTLNAELEQRVEERTLALQEATARVLNELTRRELAEKASRESHSLLQGIVDYAPVTIYIKDTQGRYVQISRCGARELGYSYDQIIGKTDDELFPAQVHEAWYGTDKHILATGESLQFEVEVPLDSGVHSFIAQKFPIFDEQGTICAIGGTATDITERKQAEKAMRESEQRLKRAEAIAHLGSWEMDIATGKCVWSDEFFCICGFSPGAFLPTAEIGLQCIHPDDRAIAMQKIQAALEQHAPYAIEKRIVRPDGEIRWVHSVGEIIFDELHQPVALTGAFLDITERKRAEAALRENHALLQGVLDHAPVFIFAKDLQGRITLANRPLEALFGVGKDELLGKTDYDFHPPEIADHNWAVDREVQRVQQVVEREEYGNDPDGTSHTYLSIKFPLFDGEGNLSGTCGISTDITRRKRDEEELKHAREKAEVANRAKSIFLANMNHELRTPLNAILGFSQIMVRSASLLPEHREYLDIINRSGEHLLMLINNVLDLSKIESGRVTLNESTVYLPHLIRDIDDMFRMRTQEKGVPLFVERAPDLPRYIRTDAIKLRQVLINLLSNAIKFTNEGNVTLVVRMHEAMSNTSRQPFPPGTGHLVFEVRDTGPGIAPEEQDTLFEAFSQTISGRQAKEGTGLGLSISREFVRLMGGDIVVQSEVGRGSVFTFDVAVAVVAGEDVQEENMVSDGEHPQDITPVNNPGTGNIGIAKLSVERLEMLSPDCLNALQYAATLGDLVRIQDVIEAIRTQDSALAKTLQYLAETFQFAQIVEATELVCDGSHASTVCIRIAIGEDEA